MWQLNFHHGDISWEHITKEISDTPWVKLFCGRDTAACTEIFMGKLIIICNKMVPSKKRVSKNRIPKER